MAQAQASDRPFWQSRNGILLAAAIATSAYAWWQIALPVLRLANTRDHIGHFAITFAHMIGGSGMLIFGALNLYLAARKTRFALHRRIGQLYLMFGVFGAGSAISVTLSQAHKTDIVLTNSSLSLAMLGAAWLLFAAMGWRAARNRRFASHGDWMVRSFVLSWAFVICRLVSRLPVIGALGEGHAFIWLSWIVPLIVCELVLQWPKGARA